MVNQGVLLLSKTNGTALAGALIVGDGTGGANADLVRFAANQQLASGSAVTINSSGRLDLNGFSAVIGSLTMTGGNVATGAGSLGLNGNLTANSASASATIAGNLSLQGATRTINVAGGPAPVDLLISAVIDNGGVAAGITKTGGGTLQLTAANTYSGTTTLNGGILSIFNPSAPGTVAAGTVLNSNAVLSLNGVAVSGEALTMAGGTLASDAGTNSWTGNITLSANSVITATTNTALNLSGAISGPAGMTKTGDGTLVFSGALANTYSGLTTIAQGTLLLSKSVSNAVPGALVIGDGLGGANADVVRFTGNQQLAGSSTVTVNSSGLLDLNGFSGVVGSLTMNGGSVATAAGNLGLNGGVTANAATTQATVAGNLSLQGATRTFDVADGPTAVDLLVSAAIDSAAGTAGIIKTGIGHLEFAGANTYSGTTTVNAGTLSIFNSSGLGTTNQGTVVNSNAVLSLNGVAVSDEALTLSGGTLASDAGTNSWTGNLTLTTTSIITAATNTALNLSGAISGTGDVIKIGDGTLVFSGPLANTYSGLTTVIQGMLVLAKTTGNAVPGALLVGFGLGGGDTGVVRLDGMQQISTTSAITVNSSGLLDLNDSSDSIASLSGAGLVQLGAGAALTIGANNASSTFNGVISGAGQLVKAGGETFVLNGNNTYSGQTSVDGGQLVVNGSQPGSPVAVGPLGVLAGNGRVGAISVLGTISPGSSPGVLLSGNAAFSSNATFRVELNGPDAGSGYDQLSVAGSVSLAGALDVTLGFQPGTNDTFTIIDNDGTDPVAGAFNGLPEGSFLSIGGVWFQISYAGGPGANAVVLSRAEPPPPRISSLAILTNGAVHLQGPGQTGLSYILDATPALDPPISWTPITTNAADAGGLYQFTDLDAAVLPMRFYRVRRAP